MHELGIVFHAIRTVERVGQENGLTRIASVTMELKKAQPYCMTALTQTKDSRTTQRLL